MKRMLFALGTLTLTGCLSGLDPIPDRKYGFILTTAYSNGAPNSTSPIGVFYESRPLNLPSSIAADTCAVAAYDPDEEVDTSLDFLDAGDSVGISFKGGTRVRLDPATSGPLLYEAAAPVNFAAGDTLTATIPGAGSGGFPEMTIAGKTAEPFTIQPITPPEASQPLQLRWSDPAGPGSKMIVSLRYRLTTGSSVINQLYCDMIDDGEYDVPSAQLNAWRNDAGREAVAFRLRITSRAASNALLQLVSSYQVPTPAAP